LACNQSRKSRQSFFSLSGRVRHLAPVRLSPGAFATDLRSLGELTLRLLASQWFAGEVGGLVGETGDVFGNLAPRRSSQRRSALRLDQGVYVGLADESGVAGILNARR
jgi:hypothetical protein